MTVFLEHYSDYPDELTIKQASIVTGYTVGIIRSAIAKKKLSAFLIGRRWIIPKVALRSYILSTLSLSERDKELVDYTIHERRKSR